MATEVVEVVSSQKDQVEADLKRYHAQFIALGLSANPAASYAMKWATKSSVPVNIADCYNRCNESPLTPAVVNSIRQDFEALFRKGDTLYMSCLLYSAHCRGVPEASSEVQPEEKPTEGSARMDMQAVFNAMHRICEVLQSQGCEDAIIGAIKTLLTGSLAQSLKWNTADAQAAILVILLLLPPLESVDHLDDVMVPLLQMVEKARHVCARQLHLELTRLSRQLMKHAVFVLQQFMTIRLYRTRLLDSHVSSCCNLLQVLYDANQQLDKPISHNDFYNDVVNSPDFNLEEDFKRWRSNGPSQFCFCRFPFMYGPAAKAKILMFDNVDHQMGEIANMLLSMNPMGSVRPYLVLQVRRGPEMVHDALTQIRAAMNTDSLRKPLKVKFVGEQGVDEGGVAKEFFHLVMKDCFSPNYGMFTFCDTARMHWFHASATDLSCEFDLIGTYRHLKCMGASHGALISHDLVCVHHFDRVFKSESKNWALLVLNNNTLSCVHVMMQGIVIGLAIYNSHILEFTFPMAIYKKLLGRPVGLDDLKEMHSDIYASLIKLLEYPADQVEADMGLTFQVEHEVDFHPKAEDLVPNGDTIPVTGQNRREFVDKYVDFLLNRSIKAQFEAFRTGFQRLCSGAVMDMFNPEELELLICGSRELNFVDLQRGTVYEGGYSEDTDVIKWFWKAVHEYDDDLKKMLLLFVTSSYRVPIDGLASLSPPFRISKNGPHTDRLPTAHTCFNILLLPQYESEDALRTRLKLALENAEGFGLM